MKPNFNFFNCHLARRMTLAVILISTLITFFTSAAQIYYEYQLDVEQVNNNLNQIEKTHLSGIASRVWVLDMQELESTLNSIMSISSIEYIAVYEAKQLLINVGDNKEKNIITKKYPLLYHQNNKNILLGHVIINASLEETYQHIINRSLVIIITNLIKTLIVAGLIMLMFYHLVAKHLSTIANFATQLSLNNLDSSFDFARNKKSGSPDDELDLIKTALGNMQENLINATEQIKQREENLNTTLNSIGDAVITTDSKGLITRLNPVAEQMTGWSNEEAKNQSVKNVFIIIDSSTRKTIENPIDQVLETGKTVYLSNNSTLISKSGQEYHIQDSAAPIRQNQSSLINGMVLVFHDITEQYKLRQSAEKSKQSLQAIMDNSPAVIYVKDLQGQYTFINKRFVELYELNNEKIIGRTLHDLFNADIADTLHANDQQVIQSTEVLEVEEQISFNGHHYIYNSIKFPLLNNDNKIYAICGISTDISNEKLQEDKLRRSQKIQSLGKLTGGIAHDYNNMLGVIIGYSDLLITKLTAKNQETKLANYVEHILHAAQRGEKLTKRLLSFSQIKSSQAANIDINDFFSKAQDMLQKTLTVQVKLKINLAKNIWPIFLDETDLEDTVLNLCINAMHAMQGSGKLTIETQNKNVDDILSQQLQIESGDYVLISFSDTGCGMDKATSEQIFEPFFTTKDDKGTGLGLSQVYNFVHHYHGTIKIYSELGIGSQFNLFFPRKKSIDNKEIVESSQVIVTGDNTESILIVDDEALLASLSSEILSAEGYTIFAAENAQEALDLLKNNKIDILFSDVIMPEMNGFELAKIVQKQYPNIKIQLTSGFSDIQNFDIDPILSDNILAKPYTAKNLIEKISDLKRS